MEIMFRPMREQDAEVIISYKHGNDYACFDSEKNQTDIDSLLSDPEVDIFVAYSDEEDILGFAEVAFDEDGILEMSGALLPEFTGMGLGCNFITECVNFLVERYDYGGGAIRTLILPGDKHSVKVLERVGFQIIETSEDWIEMQIDL
ncbi:GNAT family N-acetyltransferase [Acidaminobacter hydrogenoformans]|uniref:Ribosomal protein S18 acetylase RimI n=1 Tax=Acidaminobacter hydrogenoformans DSM 2784 TaxID=1120920 RepID=A0A1G5RY92_9FIRM|nr:GNAT family N-acetyltransferase [Acidaminobacter hydrogenoformans]SCZ78897.1 Ribosomal protein S18 acetylase RimI [Acidaminobacter hydrogenoformans DSM 2784]